MSIILTYGKIVSGLPAAIHSPSLNDSLISQFGQGIGWAVEYDNQKNIAAIKYEYDQALGYDSAEIEDFFRAYTLPANKDDDEAEVEKRRIDEQGIAARVKALEARVAELEGAKG